MEARVKFLDWTPDAEDTAHGGLTEALNVLPDTEGYKEYRSGNSSATFLAWSSQSVWLDMRSLGYDSGSYIYVYHRIADNNALIGTVDELSASGSPGDSTQGSLVDLYTGPAGATAGSLRSFSVAELSNVVVAVAKFDFATSAATGTTIAGRYATFTNGDYTDTISGGNLPNSAAGIVCGRVNQFIVLGNDQTGNKVPDFNSVRWCAIGDATDWPTPNTDDARSKQSGKEVLPSELGEVTGVAGNDFFGYVFQESGITKMTYVGGDVVFSFDTFEESRGCGYYERFVQVDDKVFFESTTGRHVVENGQVVDIGYGRVDDSYPPVSTYFKLRRNTALGLIFFSNGLVYNYKTDQWSRIAGSDPVLSIDDKDGVITSWTTQASTARTWVYTSNGGTAKDATIVTAATDINKGGRAVINGARPLANNGTYEVRIGTQDNLSDSVTWVTGSAINTRTGYSNLRAEGRYVRAEVKITGGFDTALGADIDWSSSGKI